VLIDWTFDLEGANESQDYRYRADDAMVGVGTGPRRQVKLRGLEKGDGLFVFSCAAHNLLWLPRVIAQQQPRRLMEQCS
jgi:hypothetical protein